MGVHASKDAATEEGIVYVETQKSAGEQDIDVLLAKLQELPQAAPLLKETLNDINWKDLEALRKIDADHVLDTAAAHALLATVTVPLPDAASCCQHSAPAQDVCASASRRVTSQQDRVHIKVQQAEQVATQLANELQGYVGRVERARAALEPAAGIVERLEELQNRTSRAEAQADALRRLLRQRGVEVGGGAAARGSVGDGGGG